LKGIPVETIATFGKVQGMDSDYCIDVPHGLDDSDDEESTGV
jgi:hypothetical protein